jgi:uncharacterized protein YndB with AHSA1/START domain
MVDVETSTIINRPVATVFAFVQDENNIPKWDPDLLKATKTSDGPFGVGTTFRLEIKPFMGATEGSGRVVAYEPDRRIEMLFEMGKMKPHVFHLFEPAGEGGGATKFTRRIQMEAGGVLGFMLRFMGGMLRRKNVGYLKTLKGLIDR